MLGNFILVMYVFFVWSTTHDYIKIYINLYLRTYSWIYVQCTEYYYVFSLFTLYLPRPLYIYICKSNPTSCLCYSLCGNYYSFLYLYYYFYTYCVRISIKKVAVFLMRLMCTPTGKYVTWKMKFFETRFVGMTES